MDPPLGAVLEVSKSESKSDSRSDFRSDIESGERKGPAHETFATAGLDSYYKPIPSYEGAHRYDPEFVWEPEEEKKVVRKVGRMRAMDCSKGRCKLTLLIYRQIDMRICSWVCVMF